MKKLSTILLILIAGIVASAPVSNFSATGPTQYEDGTIIPTTDSLTYKLYCSDIDNGTYATSWSILDITSFSQDVADCVNGLPGTYYFVVTAISSVFASESGFSNIVSRLYSASDLGKVPLAPTLFTVQ